MADASYDNDQFEALMRMHSLTTQEQQLAQQQALTQALREKSLEPSSHKDWGSQAARAMHGIAGAMGQMQNMKAMDQMGKDRSAMMGQVSQILARKKPRAISPMEMGDPTGQNFDPMPPTDQAPMQAMRPAVPPPMKKPYVLPDEGAEPSY